MDIGGVCNRVDIGYVCNRVDKWCLDGVCSHVDFDVSVYRLTTDGAQLTM